MSGIRRGQKTRDRLREREPGDVDWTSEQDRPTPVSRLGTPRPAPAVPDILVTPFKIEDGNGIPRRAALRLEWTGEIPAGAKTLQFEMPVLPGLEIVQRCVVEASDRLVEVNGVLPATTCAPVTSWTRRSTGRSGCPSRSAICAARRWMRRW